MLRHLLLACLILGTQLPSANSKMLEVGIEHSEMLAPVPEDLQVGQGFQKRKPKSADADRWAIIPGNTAGQWRLVRKFDASSVDLKTGKRINQPPDTYGNSVTYIGYQIDNKKQIWTSGDIESRLPHSNGTYLVPTQWELRPTSDHSFTVIKRGYSVSVDPKSHVIQDTKQLETFAIFDVFAPGKLIQKYSTQWFNAAGEAVRLTEGQTEMEKVANFEAVNELNGIDIRYSFHRFLKQ